MLERGGLGLSQAVDVEHHDQVVQLVVTCEVQRLPHTALGRLAVTHQTVHPAMAGNSSDHIVILHTGPRCRTDASPVRRLVEVFPDVRHTGGDRQPLTQRAGADVYEVQPGRGVTLEVGGQFAEVLQVVQREQAGLRPGGV